MTVHENGAARLAVEIAHLRGLDLDGLRSRWRSTFARQAPAHLPKHLLLRILAYRLQVNVYGDLDKTTARFLVRLAASGLNAGASVPLPNAQAVKPGTQLLRDWEGVTHRVMALESGYAWDGGTYKSLSHVARAITGTRWNGPRFFGLREDQP